MRTIPQKALPVLLFLLAAAMAGHVFQHFAPGAMSPDSLSILGQARSGVFEDGHPPLVTAVWRLLDRAVAGPVGMLLLHLSMFYGGLFLIFRATLQRHGLLGILACLCIGLFPPLLGILGVIWIDITMAGLYLLALGCWLSLLDPHRRAALLVLPIMALAIATRHNAAAAALPLLTLFMLRSPAAGKVWTGSIARAVGWGTIATVLLFFGTKWLSAQFVDQPRHLWRAAALYDIAGASHYEDRNLFHPGVLVDSSLDEIHRLYSPRSYFPLMTGDQIHVPPGTPPVKGKPLELDTSNANLSEVLGRNWLEVIQQHPQAYLRHRIDFFMSMIKREPWGLWAPYFDMIYPNQLGIAERRVARSTEIFWHIRWLSISSRLFEPLPYLVISALLFLPVFGLGLMLRDRLLQASGALYASGVFHMGGLFFFAVTPDFRYSHWLLTATAVASGLLALFLSTYLSRAVAWIRQALRDKRVQAVRR